MIYFIEKFLRIGLTTELFKYLSIKEICKLLVINKGIRENVLEVNKLIPQQIKLNNIYINEVENAIKLKNMLFSFPNISFLYFKSSYNLKYLVGESILVLYKTNSICNSLKKFTISMSDEGVNGISTLKYIQELDISHSSITVKGLIEVCLITTIRSLNISYCKQIKNEDLCHLSKLTFLNSLDMNGFKISNNGLLYLSNISCMKNLNLIHIHFHFDHNVSEIWDNHNVSNLSKMSNISSLNLCNSAIDPRTLMPSLTTLISITSLDLSCNWFRNNDDFSLISLMTNLKYLSLREIRSCQYNNKDMIDVGMNKLKSLTQITELILIDCSISDLTLYHISALISLQILRLSWNNNKMTNTGLEYLCNLKNMSELNIFSLKTSMDKYLVIEDTYLSNKVIDMLCNLTDFFIDLQYLLCCTFCSGGFCSVLDTMDRQQSPDKFKANMNARKRLIMRKFCVH